MAEREQNNRCFVGVCDYDLRRSRRWKQIFAMLVLQDSKTGVHESFDEIVGEVGVGVKYAVRNDVGFGIAKVSR